MLGAGLVIIQPSSGKVLLCCKSKRRRWFLPTGRKDVGESIEQAALREVYEEIRKSDTGLPTEQDYVSHLLDIDEA
ncbi:hypothetical protein WOLCODRAFT_121534, partial [Wolfiporia cocos MD-104 SS10]